MTTGICSTASATIALSILLACAAPAFAQKEATANARVHYEQGEAYFRAGAFDMAAAEYLAAYELVPKAVLLFNAALAYQELGTTRKAIEHYTRYLSAEPNGSRSAEARARLLVLQRADATTPKATANEARMPTQAAETTTVAPSGSEARSPSDADHGDTVPGDTLHVAVGPGRSDRGRSLRVIGISAAVAGVSAFAVAGYFAIEAEGKVRDANDAISAGEWERYKRLGTDHEQAQRSMTIAMTTGGVLFATGAALYYIGWTRRPADAPVATPVAILPIAGHPYSGFLVTTQF